MLPREALPVKLTLPGSVLTCMPAEASPMHSNEMLVCSDSKSKSATREQAALLDLLGVVMPFELFRAGNESIFPGRNRDVMCADDLGTSHIGIPACGDLHGLSRKGRGCHGLAFITALNRCGLAGETTTFLVFQAVVVRGFVVTIFR